MNSHIFDKFSFVSVFLIIVLLPIFCLPFTSIPVEISKGLLLVVGLALAVSFWAIARFMDGKITFPRSRLLLSGFAISLVFLLSALLSHNPEVSLFGTMFDISSFWFIFSSFILMLVCSIIFRTPKHAKIVLLWTILSSAFVLVFQIIHLFIPHFTSLGILTDKTSNIFGSWNSLGLFAGFSALLFLLVIEFFAIHKREKIILEVFLICALFLIATVNFSMAWVLLGISSLIIFVYKVSISLQNRDENAKGKYFPFASFVVVMISLLFFLNPLIPVVYPINYGYLDNLIPNHLQILHTEVSPSFGATMSVTKGVLTKHIIAGIGPNRFAEAWAMWKPPVINNSQFWDTSFDSGSGLLPTLIATTGLIGILSWLAFIILFLITGIQSVFSGIKKGVNWETMSFFVLSLYLLISSFFYSLGAVMFLLCFAFIGIFIGLVASNSKEEISISFLNDHRKSFFSILSLIVLIVLSLAMTFKYIERFASISYFEKTLSSTTEPAAEDNISKAISLYVNDLYLRTYSQVFITKLNSLINKGGSLSEADKAQVQPAFEEAVKGAQLATMNHQANYVNFQLLGSIYQAVGAIGVKDSYSHAITAYQSASVLNPLNPGLKLSIAIVSFSMGNIKDAKDYANQALSLKPDYVDALVFLSQIAKSEGNSTDALSYAQKALVLDPANKELTQYVNSLHAPVSTSVSNPTPNKSKQ